MVESIAPKNKNRVKLVRSEKKYSVIKNGRPILLFISLKYNQQIPTSAKQTKEKKEKEERTKGNGGQERSSMWATDKSTVHRRAFKRVHTPSLVAEKRE